MAESESGKLSPDFYLARDAPLWGAIPALRRGVAQEYVATAQYNCVHNLRFDLFLSRRFGYAAEKT